MRKLRLALMCLLLISVVLGCSQPGSSTPSPSVPTVYAAGFSDNSSGVDVPGYWKDGTWNSVPAWRYPATGRTAPGTV